MKKAILIGIGALALLLALPVLYFDHVSEGSSRCYGAPGEGRLEGALRPPAYGATYRSYCLVCILALRTYGHERAIGSMVAAYEALAESHPDTRFVYGEIGWPWGGPFQPHHTHQTGLSIDFMVPLKGAAEIRTDAFNRFGYDEVFDAAGKGDQGEIDFAAIAAHLIALDAAARTRESRIARVILAPDLQDDLFAAPGGAEVEARFQFNQTPSWVRHDEHYHVDFEGACAAA